MSIMIYFFKKNLLNLIYWNNLEMNVVFWYMVYGNVFVKYYILINGGMLVNWYLMKINDVLINIFYKDSGK